ncbi:MAG: hypothetical protein Q9220_007244 [cf. Caloplaca sp. 1 TL-2023]
MSIIWKLLTNKFVPLTYPSTSFEGKTVVVTGANVGLGLESARHYVRLNAAKVIIAVRSLEKGEAAKRAIEESEHKTGVVEVWHLDLSSYESVKQFANKINTLSRLDILLENAGIAVPEFRWAEDNESTITVNVVSTFLLALLALPKLRETSTKFNTTPHLTVVSSEVHFLTTIPEKSSPNIFEKLNDKATVNMADRYQCSKLLEVLYCRSLASHMKNPSNVVLNFVTPGLCHSELAREAGWGLAIMKFFLARTTEAGSRNFIAATIAGQESHGKYVDTCRLEEVAPFVTSEKGIETQKRIWEELNAKLEKIQPGVTANI